MYDTFYTFQNVQIESTNTTSMETVSTGVLDFLY